VNSQTAIPPVRAEQLLRLDPFFNIPAASAMVRICRDQARGNLLRATGSCHSHHPPLTDACRQLAIASAMRRFGGNTAR
jgi:hypothetical protein